MNTFGLEIYASDKKFYAGRGKILVVPAPDGEKAVLAHHENMIVAIVPGTLRFETEDGEKREAIVSGGLAEVVNNRVKVFVHAAERPEDIDVVRAREAKEHAEEQRRQKNRQKEYYRNQMALARAMSRLSVASRHNIK